MDGQNQPIPDPVNTNQSNVSQDTNFAGSTAWSQATANPPASTAPATDWASVPSNPSPVPTPPPAPVTPPSGMGQGPTSMGAPNFANPGGIGAPPPNNYSVVGGKKSVGAKGILSWLMFIFLAIIIIAGTGYYVLFYSKNPNSSLSDVINMMLGRSVPDNTIPPVVDQIPIIPPDTAPIVVDTAPIDTGSTSLDDELDGIDPEVLDDFDGIQVN
jgi:hypothetical protein